VRVLLDINVLLDVLADREPFAEASGAVLSLVEREQLEGWIAAHSVTTLFYLLGRELGRTKARRVIRKLLGLLEVAAVEEEVLADALDLPIADYEDAVQAACASVIDAQYLVTRNTKDFRKSDVPALAPTELLAVLAASEP